MALHEEMVKEGNFLFKYRSYLPIGFLVPALIFLYYSCKSGNYTEVFWYEMICLAVSLLGLFIRCITIGFSADNTSGRNTAEGQIADEINATGMYSLVRHPLYVGNFFMWLGLAMMVKNTGFIMCFIALYYLYYERIMMAEENFLIDKFGDRYKNWAAKVAPFIPKSFKWTKAKYSFSWVKIIRQEKSGILNLFLIFFLLKALITWLIHKDVKLIPKIWLYMLIGAVVYYILIKTIQKTTTILKFDR
jgi:protein-S-isoprenylcysteine O-methyltransferase Ste14